MPRLTALPRPARPAGGMPPCPIVPNYDRYYVLDEAGQPLRVYDYTEHSLWVSCEGKAWHHRFAGWPFRKNRSRHRDGVLGQAIFDPPVFRTAVSGCLNARFDSLTWEKAEDKHRRVSRRSVKRSRALASVEGGRNGQ